MNQQYQVKQLTNRDMNYAIGTSASTLSPLRLLRTPYPDQVVYDPASVYYSRGDASRVGDGYATVAWVWDVISLQKLAAVLEYLNGADFADVCIRTDKRDGTFPNPRSSFAVFACKMWKPILSGREGTPLARSPYALQTVSIMFKDLVEQ